LKMLPGTLLGYCARFMGRKPTILYLTVGFREIGAFEGSEIPIEFQDRWIFVEVVLRENRARIVMLPAKNCTAGLI
jgi:hypothetical protein